MDLTDVQVELDILCRRFRISTKLGGIFLTIFSICIPSDSTILLLLLSRDPFFHWPTFHACRVLQINLNLYKAQLIQVLGRSGRFHGLFWLDCFASEQSYLANNSKGKGQRNCGLKRLRRLFRRIFIGMKHPLKTPRQLEMLLKRWKGNMLCPMEKKGLAMRW